MPEPVPGDSTSRSRQDPDARPVPEADAFVFTARPEDGWNDLPWGTDDLTLVFDQRGIAIRGASPGARDARDWASAVFPWSSVTRVVRGATEAAPDGRNSITEVDIEASGRTMRFAMRSSGRDPVQLTAWSEQVQRWAVADDRTAGTPRAEPVLLPRTVPTLLLPDRDSPAWEEERDLARPVPGSDQEVGSDPSIHGDQPVERGRAAISGPVAGDTPALQAAVAGPVPPRSARGPLRRWRRMAGLAAALVIVVAGTGFALEHFLSGSNGSPVSALGPVARAETPDQAVADRIVLGSQDLPPGWMATSDRRGPGTSSKLNAGESRITASFAQCMGIDDARASAVLGGGAADQTALKESPVFVGPPTPGRPGYALELQTEADVVRSPQDEQQDFALFADPRYPQCTGSAMASEAQLGADSTAGTSEPAGQASVSPVAVPTVGGEQASGLLATFAVSERSASIPVEMITISLGYDRIEANLQALAIGGGIPSGAFDRALSDFEQRVVEGGAGAQA